MWIWCRLFLDPSDLSTIESFRNRCPLYFESLFTNLIISSMAAFFTPKMRGTGLRLLSIKHIDLRIVRFSTFVCIIFLAYLKATHTHTFHTIINYIDTEMDIEHHWAMTHLSLSLPLSLLPIAWNVHHSWNENVHHFHLKWFSIKLNRTQRKKSIK